MPTRRTIKITISIVVYLSILFLIIGWNWIDYQNRLNLVKCENEKYCIRITGNVSEDVSIGLSFLTNNETFDYYPDTLYNMNNSWATQYRKTVAGVSLADILQKTNFISEDAKYIQFQANDGFSSFKLPLQVVYDNPQYVLLIHRVNGQDLGFKEEGDDGPIMGFVALEAIQNNPEIIKIFQENGQDAIYNSVYNVKWVSTILII